MKENYPPMEILQEKKHILKSCNMIRMNFTPGSISFKQK